MRSWIRCNDYWKTKTEALRLVSFQIKVSVGEGDEFTAFLGLWLGRKEMGRDKLCPAVWPLEAALRLISSIALSSARVTQFYHRTLVGDTILLVSAIW